MDFELRQLRHARALAEDGSFARAARTLHLTQPALSRSIQELERRTGIKLFDRNQGRVELTDLGRVFLAHARELLGQAEALDREVATMRGSGTGTLILGSGTFPTAMFMAQALAAFLRKNPKVAIRVVNDNWVALVAALRRRELDLLVAAPPAAEDSTDLATHLLSPRQGYFLVRPGHPLLAKRTLCTADILEYPLVCVGHLSTALTVSLLELRGAGATNRPIPDVACESHELMRRIAASTDHVLMSTLAASAKSLERGELVALPVVDRRIVSDFAVVRLKARTLPSVADELMLEVVMADRAAAQAERLHAARLFGPAPGGLRLASRERRGKVRLA